MKIYRIIGSVFGALLTAVLIVGLAASLFLFSAANLITNESIDKAVSTAMEDEAVQKSLTDMLADSLQSQLSSKDETIEINKEQLQSSVSDFLTLSSVQGVVSGIISDTVSEMTSGSFDGELSMEEKLTEAIVSDPDVLNSVTSDIVGVMMNDETMRQYTAEYFEIGELDAELQNELFQAPEVQELVSDTLAHMLMVQTGNDVTPIDMSEKVSGLITENPELFEKVIDTYIPDEQTKSEFISEAEAYAEEIGAVPPSADLSNVDLVLYMLDLYKDNINESFNETLGTVPKDSVDIDYTDYETPVQTSGNASTSNSSLIFDEESVRALNEIALILSFFRSAAFIGLIIAAFVIFYFLMALLTWSFRYPLIFTGTASILTGITLLIISGLPIADFLKYASGDEAMEFALGLVASVWSVLAGNIVLTGIICIVLGVVMIAGFVLTHILLKKKHTAPAVPEQQTICA